MLTLEQQLKLIEGNFIDLKLTLTEKLINPTSHVPLNHHQLKQQIFAFADFNPKPSIKHKVTINTFVRSNIRSFIQDYVKIKFLAISKNRDPQNFVFVLNEIWNNYQRFVFAHEYVCDRFKQFFETFPKMNSAREFAYAIDGKFQEVVHISIIAVNELKKFFEAERVFGQFTDVFSQFLLQEREKKMVPRQQIRQTLHSLESCYFDFEAICGLDENGKSKIFKRLGSNENIPINRRATDHEFFSKYLLDETLLNCANFYKNFVANKAIQMNANEQISKILQYIEEEESRATYYIHTIQNRQKYINCLNSNLIIYKMVERMRKEDGLKAFLEAYDEKKDDYLKEIRQFWKVYSRILDKSLPTIKQIYCQYMLSEAKKVSQKSKKPIEFIQEMIRVNSKSLKIVEYFNGNFQIENERNIKVRGMLSNQITEEGRKEGKFDIGARNLVFFIHQKFKAAYNDNGIESLGETYKHIVNLFKILQEKMKFITEEEKMMSTRILEDIDFSKPSIGHIIPMEKHFVQIIQKECGLNEVLKLAENIKDIEKSIQISNKLKDKVQDDKLFPLNQIIIKTAAYWTEKTTYALISPPLALLRSSQNIEEYFKMNSTNIQFQFNNGVSNFRGDYGKNKKPQNFQFKNIYLLILLFIDEAEGKTMLFGNLKKKIQAVGASKLKAQIEFVKNVIQLLYSGLLKSSTKELRTGDPNLCKLVQSDEFEINLAYNFVEEEKKKKGEKGVKVEIKPLLNVKTSNLQLSDELKRKFDDQFRAFNDDEKIREADKKIKVQALNVKLLKQKDCSFDYLLKETQTKYREFRVEDKYLKGIIEELINKDFCKRVEGQRNIYTYVA